MALDKKRYDLRNYFNEARLVHFPIHRKVLKSLLKMSGAFFMISSNLLMYYTYFFSAKTPMYPSSSFTSFEEFLRVI